MEAVLNVIYLMQIPGYYLINTLVNAYAKGFKG